MKRFHVHVSVTDLEANIRFYSHLFGAPPTVRKDDYAKWMLDDPRVNFAVSRRGARPGVDHLGVQVGSADELEQMRQQVEQAGIAARAEPAAECCYARADKHWTVDPQGLAWETFHTLDAIPVFGVDRRDGDLAADSRLPVVIADGGAGTACCVPATEPRHDDSGPQGCQTERRP